jgi:hypothetical protein
MIFTKRGKLVRGRLEYSIRTIRTICFSTTKLKWNDIDTLID